MALNSVLEKRICFLSVQQLMAYISFSDCSDGNSGAHHWRKLSAIAGKIMLLFFLCGELNKVAKKVISIFSSFIKEYDAPFFTIPINLLKEQQKQKHGICDVGHQYLQLHSTAQWPPCKLDDKADGEDLGTKDSVCSLPV